MKPRTTKGGPKRRSPEAASLALPQFRHKAISRGYKRSKDKPKGPRGTLGAPNGVPMGSQWFPDRILSGL